MFSILLFITAHALPTSFRSPFEADQPNIDFGSPYPKHFDSPQDSNLYDNPYDRYRSDEFGNYPFDEFGSGDSHNLPIPETNIHKKINKYNSEIAESGELIDTMDEKWFGA
jgi:hypothetical protein